MRHHLKILLAVAVIFFALTSWFGRPAGGLYGSPDETANAFWAGRVAEGRPLAISDPLVGVARGAIHPRSMAVRGDLLLPGSFPGLFFLYGAMRSLVPLPFWMMTPLVTAVAGLLFYALMRRLFPEGRTAFFSAALFYLHPAVIYYSTRGLFHNVLLIDLLIVSAAFFVFRPCKSMLGRGETLDDFFGGAVFGFAAVTRTAELPWMIGGVLLLLPLVGKARWRGAAAAALGSAIPILMMLTFNAAAYGSPIASGYAPAPAAAPEAPAAAADPETGTGLLPFGFHPRLMLLHGWSYGLAIFWWFSLPVIAGLAVFAARRKKSTPFQNRYLFMTAVASAWLLLLYGSWYFRDHYDPTKITIGTSYVRYFLPMYVLSLPFAALAIDAFAVRSRRPRLAAFVMIAALAALSLRLAVAVGDESLAANRKTLQDNVWKKSVLRSWLPEDAVLVTARFDKVVFPEIVRIVPLTDDASLDALGRLVEYAPVYHYGPDMSAAELDVLEDRLHERDFAFVEAGRPIPGETLHEIIYWPYGNEDEEDPRP